MKLVMEISVEISHEIILWN